MDIDYTLGMPVAQLTQLLYALCGELSENYYAPINGLQPHTCMHLQMAVS